jgi:hypothetical protein
VQHYVNAASKGARQLLESAGYAPVRGVYVMETELDEAPPPPGWPAGIFVRAFVPGRDERVVYEAVEDAFRDVWGRPRNTFERFLQETEREGFDPSLWFLALDGGGISGVALCKIVGIKVGWTSWECAGRGGNAGWDSPSCARLSPSTTGAASGRSASAWTPRASLAPAGSADGPGGARQGELRHSPQRTAPQIRPRHQIRCPLETLTSPGFSYQTNV